MDGCNKQDKFTTKGEKKKGKFPQQREISLDFTNTIFDVSKCQFLRFAWRTAIEQGLQHKCSFPDFLHLHYPFSSVLCLPGAPKLSTLFERELDSANITTLYPRLLKLTRTEIHARTRYKPNQGLQFNKLPILALQR